MTRPLNPSQRKRNYPHRAGKLDIVEDQILSAIANGKPAHRVCQQFRVTPGALIHKAESNPLFAQRLARARLLGADAMVAEALDIADDARNDFMERNGHTVVDNEAIQRSRLRVDMRKWLAAKFNPALYGDRIDANVTLEVSAELAARLARGRERLAKLDAPVIEHEPDASEPPEEPKR